MLSPIARLLLGVPATSVASERAFSEAKLIDTRLRSMLGDEIFGDLIFISKNLPDDSNLDEFMSLLHQLGAAESAARKLLEELNNIVDVPDDTSDELGDDFE